MKYRIKHWIIVMSALSLFFGVVTAEESEVKQVNGLKQVMRGLLEETQQLTAGIFLQDFRKIELAANKIANHPGPGMVVKTKLIAKLGPEMAKFKQLDSVVHNAAVVITRAAAENNMATIMTSYHQLIDGCQSCHSEFKQHIAKVLEE